MVWDLYNLIILSGSTNPNLVSRSHTPRSSYFLRFDNFIVFNLWLWRKQSPVWKLQLGLWSYALIRLLSPSGTYVVSRPQTLRSRNFLRFHDFIRFISWFLRKWSSVWDSSAHMARYVFWAQVAQMYLVSRSQTLKSR